jgi:hypothetical protein
MRNIVNLLIIAPVLGVGCKGAGESGPVSRTYAIYNVAADEFPGNVDELKIWFLYEGETFRIPEDVRGTELRTFSMEELENTNRICEGKPLNFLYEWKIPILEAIDSYPGLTTFYIDYKGNRDTLTVEYDPESNTKVHQYINGELQGEIKLCDKESIGGVIELRINDR